MFILIVVLIIFILFIFIKWILKPIDTVHKNLKDYENDSYTDFTPFL